MTDKEDLLALLTQFGVTPEPVINHDTGTEDETIVSLLANKGNVIGYTDFVCDWRFTEDGKFVDVGVWE